MSAGGASTARFPSLCAYTSTAQWSFVLVIVSLASGIVTSRRAPFYAGLSTFSQLSAPRMTQSLSVDRPPVAWTIAGSDSGGGAGIQADLRAMHALGVHGCSVITALTAQNSCAVTRVEHSSMEQIRATIDALSDDLPPDAVKIGMLGSAAVIAEVSQFARRYAAGGGAVVCDPVMVSTSGARLIDDGAQAALVRDILPHAAVVTPNRLEAEALVGRRLRTPTDVESAAEELLATGCHAVLVKGGHLDEDGGLAQDLWMDAGGARCWLTAPRVVTADTHGTGCTLSSAAAAGLALGLAPLDAVVLAKAYVSQGLRAARRVGRGPGPVAQTGWPCRPDAMPWLTDTAAAGGACRPAPPPPCHRDWGLYPVVDSAAWVVRLVALGVRDIQLRVKGADEATLDEEVAAAAASCQAAGARLWVNDHWRVAARHGAYGVHLGQEDLTAGGAAAETAAAVAAAGLRLGLSTHCYSELARALAARPSYVSLGPVFPTRSKDVRFAPRGAEEVRRWRALIDLDVPLIAIGGISLADAPAVLAAGADGIAVIAAVMQAEDLPATVRAWQALWDQRRGPEKEIM